MFLVRRIEPASPAANQIKAANEGNGVNPAPRFFYYGEWKRSNNGRFVSLVDTDDAIDGAQIKRSWGKSGAALFTYAPRCFMIIYGPDEYAPSGKLNNREEVF